jgi:DNA polymerase-1
MLAGYLLQPSRRGHGLDALALRHLNYRTVKISELIGKSGNVRMDEVPVAKVAPYACEDADLALQLCNKLGEAVREQGLEELLRTLELPLVPVLAAMEWTGVKVDTEHLRGLSTEFDERLQALEQEIYDEAGHEFNVNSPKQISEVLFEEMELPPPRGKKTTHGYSTAAGVLQGLCEDHPICRYLLDYRELSKLKSTYADALLEMVNEESGRIHTSFNQTVTATGRLSSSDPNLQNIPVRTELGRRLRAAFVAGEPDMSLVSADYSQVELRVLAHCSGDPALRSAFEEGRDIHTFVAAQVHGVEQDEVTPEMRQKAKAVNFGIVYGQGPYGLSKSIGVSVQEAEQFITGYFERYPKVKEFIGSTVETARRDGFVRTLAGRKRFIEGINAGGATRAAAERISVNSVIQGSAADLIKLAMIRIHDELPAVSARSRMLMQIHDELVFEVPDEELEVVRPFIQREMEQALELAVPLVVDFAVAHNWADAK